MLPKKLSIVLFVERFPLAFFSVDWPGEILCFDSCLILMWCIESKFNPWFQIVTETHPHCGWTTTNRRLMLKCNWFCTHLVVTFSIPSGQRIHWAIWYAYSLYRRFFQLNWASRTFGVAHACATKTKIQKTLFLPMILIVYFPPRSYQSFLRFELCFFFVKNDTRWAHEFFFSIFAKINAVVRF